MTLARNVPAIDAVKSSEKSCRVTPRTAKLRAMVRQAETNNFLRSMLSMKGAMVRYPAVKPA